MRITKMNSESVAKLSLVLFCIFAVSSCQLKDKAEVSIPIKLVKTAEALEISQEKVKQFPAIVEEAEEVKLAFRVAGPIYKYYVKEGQFVKKGQLIAKMDKRDYEIQRKAVQIKVDQLQAEYARIEELKNRKSVALNDFEKMKAGKEMAESKLKNATDQLKDTKLRAPFSGYITNIMFDDGEIVNHGTPVATLIDVSILKFKIDIPASLYIKKDKITQIECTQDYLQGEKFPLTMYANNIKGNNNGLYKLYLYYSPQENNQLVPGMNVSVHIHYQENKEKLLSIPTSSLFEKEGETYVWIVKEGVAKTQKVNTNNLVRNGNIGIINGIVKGDRVISGGLNLLSEGDSVRILQTTSNTNVGKLL